MKALFGSLFLLGFQYGGIGQIQLIVNLKDASNGLGTEISDQWGELDNIYLFGATSNVSNELHRTNGTEAGTYVVPDSAGLSILNPFGFERLGNLLIFKGTHPTFGTTAYRSDGTSEGTFTLVDQDLSEVICFKQIGSIVYFQGQVNENISSQLWITDGTREGTKQLTDKQGNNFKFPCGFFEYHDKVYFRGIQTTTGPELYVTDGTIDGTSLFFDLNPGTGTGYGNGNSETRIIIYQDKLLFNANDGVLGWELWQSDGTLFGTDLFKDFSPGAESAFPELHLIDDYLYLTASDPVLGKVIWQSDGTPENTNIFADINVGEFGENVMYLDSFKEGLIVFALDYQYGPEFRRIDQDGNITLVKNVNPSTTSPGSIRLLRDGYIIYFAGNDGVHGEELWRTDGTEAGTYMITDLHEGVTGSSPRFLSKINDGFYFGASTPGVGRELYFYTFEDKDLDGDGFDESVDCDDANAEIHPDASEISGNGIDENCDGDDFITAVTNIPYDKPFLYPNPASQHLNIVWDSHEGYVVSVMDLYGRVLIDRYQATELDLTALIPGLYVIELFDSVTHTRATEMIMVKG